MKDYAYAAPRLFQLNKPKISFPNCISEELQIYTNLGKIPAHTYSPRVSFIPGAAELVYVAAFPPFLKNFFLIRKRRKLHKLLHPAGLSGMEVLLELVTSDPEIGGQNRPRTTFCSRSPARQRGCFHSA
ncbi:hypothetical protein CEXT_806001 [Caerostris extrusa]|uniref:Uncharacterized protein n=1 Tax=Caerostris extrusa TaxID=172846 RepID=A0AAV4X586_CAEEX|nr:hypothetical protein CEXT_806001 [Caerostris extrusa]